MSDSLITSHAHLIPRLARRMKRSLPTADVRELESAGYFALVKAARDFQGRNGCKFSTYLHECARGAMVRGFARPDGRRATRFQTFVPLVDVASDVPSPFDEVAKSEECRRLRLACLKLRPRHRLILRLHYCLEMPALKIGERWGWRVDRVKKELRTARAALLRAYEGREPYRRREYRPRKVSGYAE